ncbi:protein disulfide isomerase-like 2-3 [Lycium ferocissimum]|uniref:protein disulfide isomerase-like 2-3 n=1 Tax=Lycium ferocissimum TaxID=112874 RepID=UPI002814BA70|nr:protein disulfide isomerase-like 2-3 [Lycium ferocissimum]
MALLKERVHGKVAEGSFESPEPNVLIKLNLRNFVGKVLKSKNMWIVELAPEWRKTTKYLRGKVNQGHVDWDAEKSLMSKYNVQRFSTMLVFGPVPHEGTSTASPIESFAIEKLETNVIPLKLIESTNPVVIEGKCNSATICFVSFYGVTTQPP